MKHRSTRALALLLVLALSLAPAVLAAPDTAALTATMEGTAAYLYKAVPAPQIGSIGGEWAVLGLARSGYDVPQDYYQTYYAQLEATVTDCKGQLHDKKYTEYSRVILALAALGKDARNVAGYDLTLPLGDFDQTVWQGVNGPIWALLALDSLNYPMPQNPQAKTQATRQMYLERILECRLADGGWALSGSVSDPDVTGQALQALANYRTQPEVAQAVEEALACMSAQQDENGGFSTWGTDNLESCAQILVALCQLNIPLDDPRFVKNGNTVLDCLLSYRQADGSFRHSGGGQSENLMSTEQGLYSLVAALRMAEDKPGLYSMEDAAQLPDGEPAPGGQGLPGKHQDVTPPAVLHPGLTFPDISGQPGQKEIEALAARGILAGKDGGTFDPEGKVTRAEFAAIVVRALGLTPKANDRFADVAAGAWYAPLVGTASEYGIVNGSAGKFNPTGTITRQEAAVMVANAAILCGLKSELDTAAVRDILAQFTDYPTAAAWAQPALAFCYSQDILDAGAMDIQPKEQVSRQEIAQMLFALLTASKLL